MKEERYSVLCTNGYYCPEEVYTTESFKEAKEVARRYGTDGLIYNNVTDVLMDCDGNVLLILDSGIIND